MITPRSTRLIRAPEPRAMQRAIVAAIPRGVDARGCAVVLPTSSAAEALRQTLDGDISEAAWLLPDLVTREGLYARLHERLAGAPPLLTGFDRELLLRLAIDEVREHGIEPPFKLRSGLLGPIAAFYDELRRRGQTLDTFDRHLRATLEPGSEVDRGAARLLEQTTFLSGALASFERRVADSGRIDEHGLRALLLASDAPPGYRHVIVTVADRAADPGGLWPADFDLLARLPGLERIDVVATERVLASGWHERLHAALPGIDEVSAEPAGRRPALLVPPRTPAAERAVHFTARDREEELVDAVRWSKLTAVRDSAPLHRIAVLFGRPLPYVYLARQIFESAGVPYRTFDALPLAGEPVAAALDLVFTVVLEEATRTALVDLLASPHWRFEPDGAAPLERRAIAALDRVLAEAKFLGGWDALRQLASGGTPADARARLAAPAFAAALTAGARLAAWRNAPSASAQIDAILQFVTDHERLPPGEDEDLSRHLRARGAILGALAALRDAHARFDDSPVAPADLVATIRRWIEGQTFEPRSGEGGVRLLDRAAAPYADLDAVRIVGLVDTEWPEPVPQGVFYSPALLRDLGWPPESQRLTAARAQFNDLLHLPARQVSVSTFTLEADTLVLPSPLLEEVVTSGLTVAHQPPGPPPRMLTSEAFLRDPVVHARLSGAAPRWLELRTGAPAADDLRYRGQVGARGPEPYAVSRVERYLECPFKYFAAHVLRLEEEREDESGLTPLERGRLLHGVFEAFFRAWTAEGGGPITAENLTDAVARFAAVAEEQLSSLPAADRALERTYLLGSAVSPGLAERAFAFEIEHGVPVVERLLEHAFDGTYTIQGESGPERLHIRGAVDRIDVLADRSLRVVDYKLGRAPRPARALQLAVYSACAAEDMAARSGGAWPVRYAGYVAFREKNAFVDASGRSGALDQALREGQQRFLAAVHAIQSGEFPVAPDDPWLCTRCGFAHVCRKDYVGDE